MPNELKYHLKTALHPEKACCGKRTNQDMWLEPNSNWSKVKALFREGLMCRSCLLLISNNTQDVIRAAYAKEIRELLN